jgi:hypothetical protein
VRADFTNRIGESDETNNIGYAQIQLGNNSPISNPGADHSLECQSLYGTSLILNGSGSYDPDGDPLSYKWKKDGEVQSTNPVHELILSLGEHTFELTVDDGKDGTDTAEIVITVKDTTPPVTTSTLSGTLGDNSWYVSDVDVELLATDSCSGVKEIHYTIEGPGYDNSEIVEQGNNVNFNLNADGTYTVIYWAIDNAGNIEVIAEKPINREVNPPSVTPVVPSIPSSGYYTSCVGVELQTTQSTSGGYITEYSLDGGQTWQDYNGSFTICSTTTVLYRSTSNAGNVSYNIIEINIDQTPPVITIAGVKDGGTYVLGIFEGPSYEVYDATSGIASSNDNLTGGDGYGLGVFTYSVTADDNAGNTASASVTYEVIGNIEGLIALVVQYSTSGNIDRKTTKTLMNILRDALKAPNVSAQDGLLGNFIGLVSAQADKKIIPNEVANVLINTAKYVRDNN